MSFRQLVDGKHLFGCAEAIGSDNGNFARQRARSS